MSSLADLERSLQRIQAHSFIKPWNLSGARGARAAGWRLVSAARARWRAGVGDGASGLRAPIWWWLNIIVVFVAQRRETSVLYSVAAVARRAGHLAVGRRTLGFFSRRGSGWCVVARRFGTAVSFPRWTAGILYTDGCCWERDGAMRRQRLFFSVRRFRGAWRVTLGWLARLRLPYGAVRLPPGSGRVAECGRFAQGCAMGRVTCVAGPISSCPSACRAHACAEYVAVSAVQREGMWAFVRALRV